MKEKLEISKDTDKLGFAKSLEKNIHYYNGKPVNVEKLTQDELKDLLNELQVYQVQLDIQNQQILKIQDELFASNDKYASLYNFAPVGYITIDKHGIVTDANKTSTVMLGIEKINLLMKPLINFIDANDFDIYYNFCRDLMSENIIVNCELRLLRKNGSSFWGKLEGQHQNMKYGDEPYFHIVISDISAKKQDEEKIKNLNDNLEKRVAERTKQLSIALDNLNHEIAVRKKTEEDLRNAKDEISHAFAQEKELNELKTRLINMIQHEYKTPLTIILGSADLIDKLFFTNKKEKIKHYIDTIRTSVADMTRLLEDTLTLGNATSGQLKYTESYFDLVMLCRQLVAEVDLLDQGQHDIEFKTNSPTCKLVSDERIIRKILINLFTNALKFSAPGTDIKVELNIGDKDIQISITDSGIGIPEKDIERLFEPFHRGKNTDTIPGTGLGLAIVKSCLQALSGDIKVSSVLHEGATFTVILPK